MRAASFLGFAIGTAPVGADFVRDALGYLWESRSPLAVRLFAHQTDGDLGVYFLSAKDAKDAK
jgi:hypothetical protein